MDNDVHIRESGFRVLTATPAFFVVAAGWNCHALLWSTKAVDALGFQPSLEVFLKNFLGSYVSYTSSNNWSVQSFLSCNV